MLAPKTNIIPCRDHWFHQRLKKLEQKNPSNFSNNETVTNEIPKTVNKLNLQNDVKKENQISAVSSNFSIKSFRHFVDLFYQKREGMLHTLLYNNVKLISFKEGEVVINIEKISDPHFSRTIAKFISKWSGRIWQITPSNSNVGRTLHEEDIIYQQKEIEIMNNDPEIKLILNEYPGVTIYSISSIEETSDKQINKKQDIKIKEQ